MGIIAVPLAPGNVSQPVVPGAVIQDGPQVVPAASTATPLLGTSPATRAYQGVTVQSDPSNTAVIMVGTAPDATHGLALAAGASITYPEDDPARISVWTAGTGQKVNFQWI